MSERTEEQKLSQTPVTVILGSKSYEVKPLTLREAAKWRKKFVALFSDAAELAAVTSDDPKGFKDAMDKLLLQKPETVVDLFFEYTRLDRGVIEKSATSREFSIACEEVFAFEAPFFGLAMRVTQRLRKTIL